jgi:hypothetical protein
MTEKSHTDRGTVMPQKKPSEQSEKHDSTAVVQIPVSVARETLPERASALDTLPPDATDTPATDKVVDEISNEEADEVLAAEDTVRQAANEKPRSFWGKIADFFAAWLGNKHGRRWTLLALLVIIAALGTVPVIRYWALNEAGVRSSLSLTVIDADTQLPLQNVTVQVGSVHTTTNRAGTVTVRYLRLGSQRLVLQRPGLARLAQQLTIGWGENPLGSFSLKDVGQQYTILVHDYVSGAAIANAEAESNGYDALSDKNGKITLTVDDTGGQSVPVTLTAAGYATQNITLSSTGQRPTSVQLLPAQQEVYVAGQGSLYNLYTSNVAGQNQHLLLAGTPTETSTIALAVSPDGSQAALVSTRDPSYDSSGEILTAMALVNVANGNVVTIDHAEQIQLVGWIGTTIIYEEETAVSPTPDYNIIAYNYATDSRYQLATASQFSTIMTAGGSVYYAIPAAASSTTDGLFVVQPDGSGKQTILSQDVWTVLRSSYTTMDIQTANGWYSYSIGSAGASPMTGTPNSYTNRLYIDSPDGKHSAWVNTTDSAAQLLVYGTSSSQDTAVQTPAGASYPLRWLTNSDLIYRVTTSQGSADYIVNLNGGTSKKIVDVTNTSGFADGS